MGNGSPISDSRALPWQPGRPPLMLAPMQGLTNRATRALFIDWVRPDTVFTEFMRVNPVAAAKRLSAADLQEIAPEEGGVPLVVQLIGHGREALVSAALAAENAGAAQINLNLGCPFGRMTSGLTGGGMLRSPQVLEEILPALRRAVGGTLSVKLRAGYDNPRQIFDLIPLLEGSGVDFIVLHPRTVVQEYTGNADHHLTAEVVQGTTLPVIANGDIRSAAHGLQVLRDTGAAGLMIGRGAIADPLLFLRLRGEAPADPAPPEIAAMLRRYLRDLLDRYTPLFHGEAQILAKVKGILATMEYPSQARNLKLLRKARSVPAFVALLEELA